MKKGKLFLIPSFLHPDSKTDVFPPVNLSIIKDLEYFIVENLRTARRMLRACGYNKDFREVTFFELNKHTDNMLLSGFLKPALDGHDTGLLSEAGTPCIADPGAMIVEQAHQNSIRVVPLVGPSSIVLALMASGFNGQNFTFHGYLPIETTKRNRKIREIEKISKELNKTHIFIETPYRNNKLLEAILNNCNPLTMLCIASEITHPENESIVSATVDQWKNRKTDLHKKPAVFLLYACKSK